MAKKQAKKKKVVLASKPRKRSGTLEQMYRHYLAPMPEEQWSVVTDLSQPSILKQVPTRTAYSSVG
jgi:hypothetical protein